MNLVKVVAPNQKQYVYEVEGAWSVQSVDTNESVVLIGAANEQDAKAIAEVINAKATWVAGYE